MDVLNYAHRIMVVLPVCVLLVAEPTAAGPYDLPTAADKLLADANKQLCNSTQEYIKALKFLRETKEFSFREDGSRKIAEQVSRGCDGASERFSQILILLKSVGLSEIKALSMALEFAAVGPEVQKNFLEIFTTSYLAEFFDYEYGKAMKLAFELSRDYHGDPAFARADFIDVSRMCKNNKELDLPMSFCAEFAVRVARLSQFFRDGVSQQFFTLFAKLRERKDLSLDVKTALETAYGILQHGQKAPDNFFEAYEFASKDHEYDKKKALELALRLAANSHIGEKPPVMQIIAPEQAIR